MGNTYYHQIEFGGFEPLVTVAFVASVLFVVYTNWNSVKTKAAGLSERSRHSYEKTRKFAKIAGGREIASRKDRDVISLPSKSYEYGIAVIAALIQTAAINHCHLHGITQLIRNITHSGVSSRAVSVMVLVTLMPFAIGLLAPLGNLTQYLSYCFKSEAYSKHGINKPVAQRIGIADVFENTSDYFEHAAKEAAKKMMQPKAKVSTKRKKSTSTAKKTTA